MALILSMLIVTMVPAQENPSPAVAGQGHKFSVSTTWLSFANFEKEATNIQMYELHFGFRLTKDDTIGVKAATWKLFEPMGIAMWDTHLMKESEFYPGRLLEYGVGVTYQRLIWNGLFAAIEILPLKQEYLDTGGRKVLEGFRLYTTYHLGYHVSFFDDRVFLEPQVHFNYWPYMTEGPEGFREKEQREWSKNFILLEPNVYMGINF